MKLWLIEQDEQDGYDTYDAMVVAAETEHEARAIHPNQAWGSKAPWDSPSDSWASAPGRVKATLIGDAVTGIEEGIILASYNAG